MMFLLKRKVEVDAPPAPVRRISQEVADYLKPLVRAVEETWEAPDPAQYENAYHGYLSALLEPLDDAEQAIEEKRMLFRSTVERMIEIAPDFFEKALRRSAFETGFFVEGGKDGDR